MNENVSQREGGHGVKYNEKVSLRLVKMMHREPELGITSVPLLKSNKQNRTNKDYQVTSVRIP